MNKTDLATSTVFQSLQYDQFVRDRRNRKLNPSILASLRRVTRKKGLRLDLFPIVVVDRGDGTFLVWDGQHRLEIAKEMGIPVHYIVDKDLRIEDVPLFNSAGGKWNLLDYARSYAESGEESYARLLGLCADHDVSIPTVLAAAGGIGHGAVKRGDFAFTEEDVASTSVVLRRIADFQEFLSHWKWHPFVGAVRIVGSLPGYDHDRMLGRLEAGGIAQHVTEKEYVRELLSIYNRRTRQEHRLTHPRFGDGS